MCHNGFHTTCNKKPDLGDGTIDAIDQVTDLISLDANAFCNRLQHFVRDFLAVPVGLHQRQCVFVGRNGDPVSASSFEGAGSGVS
ncbi:MAG: hypothetical protein CBB71_23495 [Rhodopirellula sp. TMED11]|nr:MAG: hypothetical protein CBB71_23495 [Rhodopirellula sp. TMED11]